MRAWGGDQVTEAVAGCVELLRTVADKDWTGVRAGRLEWTCRRTAEHMASDLIAYAGQLAGRAQTAYVPFEIAFDEGTDQAGVLDVVETTGALLAATVRTTPPRVRAFHPYPFRSANREGFAAMGIAEVLLHTHDIAEGLGLAYEPPAGLCEAVLSRIFPHVRPGPEPWPTLLWATGRGELPGRAPVTGWRWHNNLVLPTERLTLEGLTPAAAADLVAGGDGGFGWLGDAPYEGTREVAAGLLKAYDAGVHRPEFGVFVIVRRADGRAVGSLCFHGMPDEEGRTEIGYDLVAPARGHGYATEAVDALARWALARDDVHLLYAAVEEANTPSQAVLTRAGFVRADVAREPLLEDDTLRLYTRRAPRSCEPSRP
ncbi:GNAT family N-acetyltransferase [Streptomyces sp. NPDC088766]|uniref:GNAT family N-acetyltransferase n=1 Tax=Streptomyces sp. NPDC088766 TaxID=3365893 RepID=UPI003800862A